MDVFSCSDGLVLTGHHRLVDNRQMTQQLVCDALTMALSDEDSRRVLSFILIEALNIARKNISKLQLNKLSMSRKGCCYDNAAMESFFQLKVELVHREVYVTRQQARQNIFEYIETYYNRQRRHSAIGNQIPMQYELKMSA